MLTSLTTFIGLVPIVFFETSMQAKIVIPMAVSLSFGVLFATVVTLFLIPSLYVIIEDAKSGVKNVKAFFSSKKVDASSQHTQSQTTTP